MIRFLVNLGVYMGAAAIGLLVADALLDSVDISYPGAFLLAVVLFAAIQALVSPLIVQVTARNAEMLTGGVGIVSALVALIVTSLFNPGMVISGIGGWLGAAVVVWLASMVAAFLLQLIFAKKVINEVRD